MGFNHTSVDGIRVGYRSICIRVFSDHSHYCGQSATNRSQPIDGPRLVCTQCEGPPDGFPGPGSHHSNRAMDFVRNSCRSQLWLLTPGAARRRAGGAPFRAGGVEGFRFYRVPHFPRVWEGCAVCFACHRSKRIHWFRENVPSRTLCPSRKGCGTHRGKSDRKAKQSTVMPNTSDATISR